METIQAKSILSPYHEGDQWFGGNYTCNLYRGCCHGCIYCDSRSACYGIEDFDTVRAKKGAIPLLRRELKAKRRGGIVFAGAMSDPYNPFERSLNLTRQSLEAVRDYGFGVALTTKSDLVTRDIDLLLEIKRHAPALVLLTVTTVEDSLSRRIEPNAPPPSRRFAALEELSRAGIFAGILMTPVLPFLEDTTENVRAMAERASGCGGKFLYAQFGVTLRQNQRDYFYKQLDRLFPGLSARYQRQYGDRYFCQSPQAPALSQCCREECRARGLLSSQKEIISAYQDGYEPEQLRFF